MIHTSDLLIEVYDEQVLNWGWWMLSDSSTSI